MDPAWPITAVAETDKSNIFVNPKFIAKVKITCTSWPQTFTIDNVSSNENTLLLFNAFSQVGEMGI